MSIKEIQRRYQHSEKGQAAQIAYRCSAKGQRAARVRLKKWKARYPIRTSSHQKVYYALKVGKIVKSITCDECGSFERMCGHHDDYNKPLEVRWLCQQCHTDWHSANEPMNGDIYEQE